MNPTPAVNEFEKKYQNMNLRPFTGHNILPQGGETEEEDPFCGEVPQDAAGYTAYRRFFESKMDRMIGGAKTMSLHANCEDIVDGRHVALHHQKPEHMGSGIVIACNHVIRHDPYNPEGGKFYPLKRGRNAGFYLCNTCMRLEERHKLNFETAVSMKCARCVLEAIMDVQVKFPGRWINLTEL